MSSTRIQANLIFFVEIHENSDPKLILFWFLCVASRWKNICFSKKIKFTARNSEAAFGDVWRVCDKEILGMFEALGVSKRMRNEFLKKKLKLRGKI